MDGNLSSSTDDDDVVLHVPDHLEINEIQKKKRGTLGKTLFPWKTKLGPELKKTLVKVIYLHGMHLPKGSDKLTKFKSNNVKWKFIA